MAKLVPLNHPALHTIAEEITVGEFSDGTVAKILKDLRNALHTYKVDGYTAVAIAAPQIGISKRIFIIEDQSKDRDALPSMVAINPVIVKYSKKPMKLVRDVFLFPNTTVLSGAQRMSLSGLKMNTVKSTNEALVHF